MDLDLGRVSDLILPLAHHQTTDDVGFPAEKNQDSHQSHFSRRHCFAQFGGIFFQRHTPDKTDSMFQFSAGDRNIV
jgi:hypothetical protein